MNRKALEKINNLIKISSYMDKNNKPLEAEEALIMSIEEINKEIDKVIVSIEKNSKMDKTAMVKSAGWMSGLWDAAKAIGKNIGDAWRGTSKAIDHASDLVNIPFKGRIKQINPNLQRNYTKIIRDPSSLPGKTGEWGSKKLKNELSTLGIDLSKATNEDLIKLKDYRNAGDLDNFFKELSKYPGATRINPAVLYGGIGAAAIGGHSLLSNKAGPKMQDPQFEGSGIGPYGYPGGGLAPGTGRDRMTPGTGGGMGGGMMPPGMSTEIMQAVYDLDARVSRLEQVIG